MLLPCLLKGFCFCHNVCVKHVHPRQTPRHQASCFTTYLSEPLTLPQKYVGINQSVSQFITPLSTQSIQHLINHPFCVLQLLQRGDQLHLRPHPQAASSSPRVLAPKHQGPVLQPRACQLSSLISTRWLAGRLTFPSILSHLRLTTQDCCCH